MPPRKKMSPGPRDRMPEILKLIAEPTSVKKKKKKEVTYYQDPNKEVNHDYCDKCAGGGEIICCDTCPRSFHKTCHYPRLYRLPIGDWFCSGCAYIDNDEYRVRAPMSCNLDINSIVKKSMDYDYAYSGFMTEIPIRRMSSAKPPSPIQFDKTDRCCVCKRGYLKAQLVRCYSCSCFYHLNCLDPPLRDWDSSRKWICPKHDKFFEMMYPDYFPPGSKTVSDREILKNLRCEVRPTQPVNSYFKIPSHIDAMYKKPEEKNIPISNSLNILCDVASFELKSLNDSNLKINENTSNNVTEKFLASQHFNKFQNINVLPKQPNAYLTCLTLPIKFSVKNEPITIGKSPSNHLCLEKYENCRFIADHHATITFDEILGDFLVKNHSMHGIIVDNVSYYGHHRSDQKKVLTYITKFLNKRRVEVRKRKLFHIAPRFGTKTLQYINKTCTFDYQDMYQYYSDDFKETELAYRLNPCKCLNRHNPNDGYTGQALLRDESLISIGCLQFKFTYNKNEITKMCSEMNATKQGVTVEDQSHEPCLRMLSEQDNCTNVLRGTETEIPLITIDDYESNTFIKQTHISHVEPCLRMLTKQDNCTNVLRGTETEIPLITIDDYESNTFIKQNHISHVEPCLRMLTEQDNCTNVLRDTEMEIPLITIDDDDESNTFIKQNHISHVEPGLRMLTEQDNCTSVLRGTETEIPLITIDDDYESNTFIKQNHLGHIEPCLRMLTEQENCTNVLRGTETEISLITIDDYESFSKGNSEDIALSHLSSQYEVPYTTQWSSINNGSGTVQLCNAEDLIQVEEISDIEEENNEDGFVCIIDYTETDSMGQNNGDIENWVIEEDAVVENGIHSNEPGPSSANLLMTPAVDFPVPDSNNEHYKTEHLHCANTQTYNNVVNNVINNVIVISSDDENYEQNVHNGHNFQHENHKSEE